MFELALLTTNLQQNINFQTHPILKNHTPNIPTANYKNRKLQPLEDKPFPICRAISGVMTMHIDAATLAYMTEYIFVKHKILYDGLIFGLNAIFLVSSGSSDLNEADKGRWGENDLCARFSVGSSIFFWSSMGNALVLFSD